MTLKELIKDKDYEYISIRYLPNEYKDTEYKMQHSIFCGECKSENGKLISLDGDVYNENAEILWHCTNYDFVDREYLVVIFREDEW